MKLKSKIRDKIIIYYLSQNNILLSVDLVILANIVTIFQIN